VKATYWVTARRRTEVYIETLKPVAQLQAHVGTTLFGKYGPQIVRASLSKSSHAGEMSDIKLKVGGRDLNDPLKKAELRSITLAKPPKAFPGFMGFPPEAVIVEVATEQVFRAFLPFVRRKEMAQRSRTAGREVTVAQRVFSGVGVFPRIEPISWKWSREIARTGKFITRVSLGDGEVGDTIGER